MTKVFQILENRCHWQTPYESIKEVDGRFSPDIQFAEAPDYVREGWSYVDGNFVEPQPPEGFAYDSATRTFYRNESMSIINNIRYEELTRSKIRRKYTDTDEYKILREYLANEADSKEQFSTYNEYVEQCKLEAYNEIYGEKEGDDNGQV